MEGTANSFPGLLRQSGSAGEKGLGTMSNLASLNNTHIYVLVHRGDCFYSSHCVAKEMLYVI